MTPPNARSRANRAGTLPNYRAEPALTIGELFADKARVKALVAAIIAVLVALGVNVAPGVDDSIVTIITSLVPMVLSYLGYAALQGQAREQALVTRDHVYSPTSYDAVSLTSSKGRDRAS